MGIDVEISPNASRMDSVGHTSRNRFSYDLTTVDGLRSYLQEQTSVHKDIELRSLTGGTANHVYRLTERCEGTTGRTVIFKHAAGGLASNPSFTLDPERMDFEAKILRRLSHESNCQCNLTEDLQTSVIDRTHVHAVGLASYEGDIKLLCLQDAGERNLKDAYSALSREEIQEIGTELGEWLAKLHGRTPRSYVTEPNNRNNKVGVNIAGHVYRNLSGALGYSDPDLELAEKVEKYFGGLIANDNECVCHGDFWPGNVMLQKNRQKHRVLTVIDWELVRVGNSATDVGQFAAEAFLLDRFHGSKGLHASFIHSYFRSSAVDFGSKEMIYPWLTRVAVHFAAHIAVWPTRGVHWANKENTGGLVDIGKAILEDAISSTPNIKQWRVFEGLQGLDEIAREMLMERGYPWDRQTVDKAGKKEPALQETGKPPGLTTTGTPVDGRGSDDPMDEDLVL